MRRHRSVSRFLPQSLLNMFLGQHSYPQLCLRLVPFDDLDGPNLEHPGSLLFPRSPAQPADEGPTAGPSKFAFTTYVVDMTMTICQTFFWRNIRNFGLNGETTDHE
jgi:hypothetical protein